MAADVASLARAAAQSAKVEHPLFGLGQVVGKRAGVRSSASSADDDGAVDGNRDAFRSERVQVAHPEPRGCEVVGERM